MYPQEHFRTKDEIEFHAYSQVESELFLDT